jgi:polysaccharide biosynthesis transport protein
MSRNYDLLRQADKTGMIFDAGKKQDLQSNARAVRQNSNERAREEILKLIHRIFLNSSQPPLSAVVFTAVESQCGCTWVCANAAEALAANVEEPICLVDANLHSPSLHRYFKLDCESGFADAMQKTDPVRSYTRQIPGSNIHILPGSRAPQNLSGVVSPERLKARFSELCSEFKYVLVDAPPVNASADSLMLSLAADGVILVIEANSTRREAARRAKETLQSVEVRILGTVLNKRAFPIPEWLYSKL